MNTNMSTKLVSQDILNNLGQLNKKIHSLSFNVISLHDLDEEYYADFMDYCNATNSPVPLLQNVLGLTITNKNIVFAPEFKPVTTLCLASTLYVFLKHLRDFDLILNGSFVVSDDNSEELIEFKVTNSFLSTN